MYSARIPHVLILCLFMAERKEDNKRQDESWMTTERSDEDCKDHNVTCGDFNTSDKMVAFVSFEVTLC